VIPNNILTTPGPVPRSYAFCSDTKYTESIVPIIRDVDLLYHEATFLSADEKLAAKTFHSSARQAAEIAKLANAKKLIIGHFSTRYKDLSLFEDEAVSVFPNTAIAKEGCEFSIPFSTR
jgi:ribonuclease Z